MLCMQLSAAVLLVSSLTAIGQQLVQEVTIIQMGDNTNVNVNQYGVKTIVDNEDWDEETS